MKSNALLSQHFQESPTTFNEALIGNKALGLYRLPAGWTPPFFVLPSPSRAVRVQDLEAPLQLLQAQGYTRIIARSSADRETLADRGLYESQVCPAVPKAVITAV